MSGSKEFHEIIECDLQHLVPDNVQVKFTDAVMFKNSNIHTGLAADPDVNNDTLGHKERYTDQTGGFYFNTAAKKFKYKGGNPIQWRFFGDGDGDVIFDPNGQAQFDNGVARWSVDSKYVQGSIATLDDQGNFSTPGQYQSRTTNATDPAFISRPAGLNQEVRYTVYNDGKMIWGPGGTVGGPGTATDTEFKRLNPNELGSVLPGAKISLTQGDSRIAAQRHLGGLGNAQADSNFRCPVVAAIVPYLGNSAHGTTGGEDVIMTHNIPIEGLDVNDSLTVDLFFETRDPLSKGYLKAFKMSLNTTPNIDVTMPIAAGQFAGWIKFTLLRLNNNDCVIIAVGMHGGSTLITSTLGNTAFNTDASPVWSTNAHQITLSGIVTGNGVDNVTTGEWICRGGRITYYNF